MTKPTKKKRFPDGKDTIQAKHVFTKDERVTLSESLARANLEYVTIDTTRKNIAAEYANKLKSVNAVIDDLSSRISNGYEMRPTEVIVKYHTPETGKKTYVRAGKVVGTETMTASDLNQDLPMPGLPASRRLDQDGKPGRRRTKAEREFFNPVLPAAVPSPIDSAQEEKE